MSPEQVFFGNGSDEPIDLLIRLFCDPEKDRIIIMPPTYGMYEVSAAINNISLIKVPLTKDFQIDVPAVKKEINSQAKMIFICSPNNPTGNLLNSEDITEILEVFQGIVVLDEAYIDFSNEKSWTNKLSKYPNLVVLQTMSKAWGMAGIRVGAAMGNPYIISLLDKIKPPYNLSLPNQTLAIEAIENHSKKVEEVNAILLERKRVENALEEIPEVAAVFPSDANFLLVRFEKARAIFDFLIKRKVIVRDRSSQINCEDCLRVTIGTASENDKLIALIKEFYKG